MFRSLLRNWLHGAAKHKLREKAVEAAEEHVRATAETARGVGEIRPCDLGIVFALGIESGGLEDRLSEVTNIRGEGFVVRQGVLHERNITLIRSGAGREKAATATEALIDGHRPGWVLSAGFAGGLRPELKRNDILMADHVADTAGGRLAIDLKVDTDSLAKMPEVHVGRLLSTDRVIRLPGEKRTLGGEHGAMAVDMETFAVAEVCRRREVRFLAVRVVIDTVDEELPPDVEHLLSQKTVPGKLGAATGSLWRRPSSLKDMYRLRENALVASEQLAKFLDGMVEQL